MSITLLQKLTGLKRQHTSRSVNGLIDRNIIEMKCTSTGTGNVRKLGIQKDYTKWKGVPLQVQRKKCTSTGTVSVPLQVTEVSPPEVHQIAAKPHQPVNSSDLKQKTIFKTKGDFFSFKKRYSNPHLIDQTVEAIKSTRKTNKVSSNILNELFKRLEKYPAQTVERGCQIYLDKNYAAQGKDEKYLLGIIRKLKNKPPAPAYEPPRIYSEKDAYEESDSSS
jgi:hypothetical protein